MYGIVLLAAMTAGESTPEFFNRGYSCGGCYGCSGCYGCYGGYGSGSWFTYGACYGACYGGCYGGWGQPYHGYGPAGYACEWLLRLLLERGIRHARAGDDERPGPGGGEPSGGRRMSRRGRAPAFRAKLQIDLPTDAKLYVDDKPIKGAAEKKRYRTPAAGKGQEPLLRSPGRGDS